MLLHKKWLFIIGAIAAVLVAALAAGYVFFGANDKGATSSIPQSIRQESQIPLYYPATLPEGWSVNPATFRQDGQIVLFVVATPSGDINVTQQARPNNFNFEKFHREVLQQGTIVLASIGEGAVGAADSKLIGSLLTDKTWILLTPSTDDISKGQLVRLMNTLTQETAPSSSR